MGAAFGRSTDDSDDEEEEDDDEESAALRAILRDSTDAMVQGDRVRMHVGTGTGHMRMRMRMCMHMLITGAHAYTLVHMLMHACE